MSTFEGYILDKYTPEMFLERVTTVRKILADSDCEALLLIPDGLEAKSKLSSKLLGWLLLGLAPHMVASESGGVVNGLEDFLLLISTHHVYLYGPHDLVDSLNYLNAVPGLFLSTSKFSWFDDIPEDVDPTILEEEADKKYRCFMAMTAPYDRIGFPVTSSEINQILEWPIIRNYSSTLRSTPSLASRSQRKISADAERTEFTTAHQCVSLGRELMRSAVIPDDRALHFIAQHVPTFDNILLEASLMVERDSVTARAFVDEISEPGRGNVHISDTSSCLSYVSVQPRGVPVSVARSIAPLSWSKEAGLLLQRIPNFKSAMNAVARMLVNPMSREALESTARRFAGSDVGLTIRYTDGCAGIRGAMADLVAVSDTIERDGHPFLAHIEIHSNHGCIWGDTFFIDRSRDLVKCLTDSVLPIVVTPTIVQKAQNHGTVLADHVETSAIEHASLGKSLSASFYRVDLLVPLSDNTSDPSGCWMANDCSLELYDNGLELRCRPLLGSSHVLVGFTSEKSSIQAFFDRERHSIVLWTFSGQKSVFHSISKIMGSNMILLRLPTETYNALITKVVEHWNKLPGFISGDMSRSPNRYVRAVCPIVDAAIEAEKQREEEHSISSIGTGVSSPASDEIKLPISTSRVLFVVAPAMSKAAFGSMDGIARAYEEFSERVANLIVLPFTPGKIVKQSIVNASARLMKNPSLEPFSPTIFVYCYSYEQVWAVVDAICPAIRKPSRRGPKETLFRNSSQIQMAIMGLAHSKDFVASGESPVPLLLPSVATPLYSQDAFFPVGFTGSSPTTLVRGAAHALVIVGTVPGDHSLTGVDYAEENTAVDPLDVNIAFKRLNPSNDIKGVQLLLKPRGPDWREVIERAFSQDSENLVNATSTVVRNALLLNSFDGRCFISRLVNFAGMIPNPLKLDSVEPETGDREIKNLISHRFNVAELYEEFKGAIIIDENTKEGKKLKKKRDKERKKAGTDEMLDPDLLFEPQITLSRVIEVTKLFRRDIVPYLFVLTLPTPGGLLFLLPQGMFKFPRVAFLTPYSPNALENPQIVASSEKERVNRLAGFLQKCFVHASHTFAGRDTGTGLGEMPSSKKKVSFPSWDIIREHYKGVPLPNGWFFDGYSYKSMDGDRQKHRPDKEELIKRYREEVFEAVQE